LTITSLGKVEMAKIFKVVFGILFLSFGFWSHHLWNYYLEHNPSTPQPGAGCIYGFENHGSVFYVTSGEWCHFYGTVLAAALCFVLSGLFYLAERRSKR
jgi:hypothetical protein